MTSRTVFMSRLFGLYCILAALSMLVRGRAMTLDIVTALIHDQPLVFFIGVVTLFGGLAMVLVHNVWSGGALPVVVTLLGWITLVKGLLFLFLSPQAEVGFFFGGLHYAQLFYFYAGFSFLLGVYLSYAGFRSR